MTNTWPQRALGPWARVMGPRAAAHGPDALCGHVLARLAPIYAQYIMKKDWTKKIKLDHALCLTRICACISCVFTFPSLKQEEKTSNNYVLSS